ncbi:hypothetical protein CHH28_07665 [Bacterioplanes sanyensis]|uniref:Uncharacterized protein n=1 Tax=Bacterioplanes sanyensis TaxID=1249553 RepID=A0A222FHU2_9GAMM|nr:hypothetical protein [Bacterioplanes sanyensis]ASP38558.1 hypothetical protein CHH28_07665 [Bacterioplanes sanyensis]
MPMLLQLSKVFQAIAIAITALVSAQTLGVGFWSMVSLAVALLLILSVFWPILHWPAIWAGRVIGLLALLALALLLLAGTAGGAFHFSDSSQIMASGLFFMFGFSILLWLFAPLSAGSEEQS